MDGPHVQHQKPGFLNPLKPASPAPDQQTAGEDSDDASINIQKLLPASFRAGEDRDEIVPTIDYIDQYLEQELSTKRLLDVWQSLWYVGRPMPPRPLNRQLFLSREIVLTDQMDTHLVWTTGKMFIKPLSRYLFEPQFWTRHLACKPECECPASDMPTPHPSKASPTYPYEQNQRFCARRTLWRCAMGFLYSYVALIVCEADLAIAKEKNLVPPELEYGRWTIFVKQFLKTSNIRLAIDARFIYGELRLSRLNFTWLVRKGSTRGYITNWNQYSAFFNDNFGVLASVTIYLAVVLTGMQVGLSTTKLQSSDAFQAASWGFTVASILGPLVFLALVFILFLIYVVRNARVTIKYAERVFSKLQEQENHHLEA